MAASSEPACKTLVLDAGPLLSLSPLRGLATRYLTVPQVLSELKDKNARDHFERLALTTGVKVEVMEPDAKSISQVIQFSKETGDYAVLSYADICVLALTLALDIAAKAERTKEAGDGISSSETKTGEEEIDVAKDTPQSVENPKTESHEPLLVDELADNFAAADISASTEDINKSPSHSDLPDDTPHDALGVAAAEADQEPLDVVLEPSDESPEKPSDAAEPSEPSPPENASAPFFEDPSDEDDGEGEWITPANVDMYKTHAMDLLPSTDNTDPFTTVGAGRKGRKGKKPKQQNNANAFSDEKVDVGCMTADFAMQNVLLQMDLNLVGTEGKRIQKVKTWVLRCHACFKICKDSTKKFCPSCGNPTLLRTTVTAKAPTADDSTPALEVHLKKNFVYRTRGTIYSIPKPKPGSAKTGTGEGLILREDQTEYMRAVKRDQGRKEKEERRIFKQSARAANAGQTPGVNLGNWMDPDWMPEMLSVGTGGKGRHVPDGRVQLGPDGSPIIGYGRKNPNEGRRKR